MSEKKYDVVVVGAGIAGAIIAKTLTRAGKTVLLLEAGLEAGIALDEDGSHDVYQQYLQTFYKAAAKAPNSPYPRLPQAPSADVLDLDGFKNGQNLTTGYLVQKGPLPFTSDNARVPGGTTLHWLGTTLRLLPNDFQMHSKYGRFVDWPFPYETLRPYYEMAELEIGVSGDVADQINHLPNIDKKTYFGKDYVLPMHKIPTSYLDGKVAAEFIKVKVPQGDTTIQVDCCSTPQGRNSTPNFDYPYDSVEWNAKAGKLQLKPLAKDEKYSPVGSLWNRYKGLRCEGNASCVPICPVQAKYDALKTIKSAKDDHPGRLTIIAQAVAYEVLTDSTSKKVTGIRYKTYKKDAPPDAYTDQLARGTIYVLATSAIENAKLLLASNAANSSDQVGRNLMDHLCLLTWGLFPEAVYPFRGPGSTTNICSFRDGDFRSGHTAWICPLDNWGWGWPVFSPGSDVEEFVGEALFGTDLRDKVLDRVSRQVLLHFECEQDPDPDNRVTIDKTCKDALGNYKPVIQYHVSEYVRRAFEAAKRVSDALFASSCIQDFTKYDPNEVGYVEYNGQGYTYRGAGHIVGTHRMGNDPRTSVVDENMRTWDHDNLYLVGCGNMPTLGTSNPTLTMAATTFKAAEAILKQLA
ncbi:MAG TPA: GMC family oxidoreductase [Puia sp.]|nr:GMC family oxidoreductase [Puia sp.]